jgi:hypothetical protein
MFWVIQPHLHGCSDVFTSGITQIFPSGWWYTYPSEKYESQLGRILPYIMENKIKFMFETTNQPYVFPCFWQFNQILHVSQFRIRLVIAIHSQVVHGYSYGFFGAPFPTQLLVVVIDSDFHGFDMFNPLGHWIDLRENLEEGKICFPPYPLLSVNIHEYSP